MILVFVGTAFAVDMEGARLAAELGDFAADGKWKGVERTYTAMLIDHPQALVATHHLLGAEAARVEGDLLKAAQRLTRVTEGEGDAWKLARADLDVLQHQCQLVVLDTPGTLQPDVLPFSAQLVGSVEFARETLERDGVFVGLLPSGSYTIDGRPFRVGAGFALTPVTLGEPRAASESEADGE